MAKILIAEDELDIRNLITFTLHSVGHEIIAATNGAEALEKAIEMAEQNDLPDLILMDVRMPRMTGYEACKGMKENPRLANIPVAFLSAKGQESEVKEGFEVGAIDYIIKPFAIDQLIKKVTQILQQVGA
ncbi:MAG: response regulator [Chloroflexi bacterium]|jgi:CheY-like chemotaxis protein|nr:response regulator [Chloroflexota bacterium]